MIEHALTGTPVLDGNIIPGPTLTIYQPVRQSSGVGRLFVYTRTENPYTLVPPITRLIREMSADQPIGKATTLEDLRGGPGA